MDESVSLSETRLPVIKYHQFQTKLKFQRPAQSQPKIISKPKVYTVNESLKDEYVLKNLDLALGSLNLFIDLKSTDPNPILPNLRLNQRVRRKNEPKEDKGGELFQKKTNNVSQEKNPFEILKTVDDEKTRGAAAKQIVQQIFKRIYGDDVDKFEEKNSKEVLQQIYIEGIDHDDPRILFIKKNIKKNMEERFELFIKQLNDKSKNRNLKLKVEPVQNQSKNPVRQSSKFNIDELEQSDEKSQENASIEKSRQNNDFIAQLPVVMESHQINLMLKQKPSFFGDKFTKMLGDIPSRQQEIRKQKQQRLNSIFKLKARFTDVNNVWNKYWKDSSIKPNSIDVEEYLEAQKTIHPQIATFFQTQENQLDKHIHHLQLLNFEQVDHLMIKSEKQEIVIIDMHKQIIMRNVEMTDDMAMWLLFSTEYWGYLTRVEFYNTKLSDAAMKLLLNVISLECTKIEQFVLSYNQLTQLQTPLLAKVLKDQTELSVLKMAGMGMGSKEFTQICLAICEGKLTTINFSNNQIDKRGLKPIETLLRYVKSLESVDLSENNLTDQSQEEKTKLFRQLRKIVIYNECLKNKNIKI